MTPPRMAGVLSGDGACGGGDVRGVGSGVSVVARVTVLGIGAAVVAVVVAVVVVVVVVRAAVVVVLVVGVAVVVVLVVGATVVVVLVVGATVVVVLVVGAAVVVVLVVGATVVVVLVVGAAVAVVLVVGARVVVVVVVDEVGSGGSAITWPNTPPEPVPQHAIFQSLSFAHVCVSPHTIKTAVRPVGSVVGSRFSPMSEVSFPTYSTSPIGHACVVRPSCLYRFCPQQNTRPSVVRMHVCAYPHATCDTWTPVGSGIGANASISVASRPMLFTGPAADCPALLSPQQSTF